jgi:dTMP kinase
VTAAAIYARVSSARQAKDQTIGSQLSALREHAATSRLEVPEDWVFADEGHSGATLVRPALARGAIVLTDRYVDSSLAYQGAGRPLDFDDVARVNAWATGGLVPDLTVLLDLDPAEGLRRVGEPDRLEVEPLEFHRRVRAKFLELAAEDPERYLVLDGSAPPEQVQAEVAAAVLALLSIQVVQ